MVRSLPRLRPDAEVIITQSPWIFQAIVKVEGLEDQFFPLPFELKAMWEVHFYLLKRGFVCDNGNPDFLIGPSHKLYHEYKYTRRP